MKAKPGVVVSSRASVRMAAADDAGSPACAWGAHYVERRYGDLEALALVAQAILRRNAHSLKDHLAGVPGADAQFALTEYVEAELTLTDQASLLSLCRSLAL